MNFGSKKKNLVQFIERLKKDADLVNQLKQADSSYTGDRTDLIEMVKQNILPVAQKAGYSFTAEEYVEQLKKAIEKKKNNRELTEDEMDAVAGGADDINIENTNINGDLIVIDNSINQNYYITFYS